jgi:hypothetical protein
MNTAVVEYRSETVERAMVEPFERFPTECLPDILRRFIEQAAKSIGCDESYIALPLLAGLASAVGNTRRIKLKNDWKEPCILWTVIVGDSGTQKTPAQRMALEYIQRLQTEAMERYGEAVSHYEDDLAKFDRDTADWRKGKIIERPTKPEEPVTERYVCADITVEALAQLLAENPRGLLVARDELAGWLGGFDAYKSGQGDVPQWLEMFQGGAMLVDRKTGQRRTIHVPRAAVSITGGIQPQTLRAVLGRSYFDNGLAARLLLAMPPRRPKRWTDATIDGRAKDALVAVFDDLFRLDFDADGEPIDLPLTESAREAWRGFYNEHAEEQVALTGDLAAAWSKLEAYAARLALLVHLCRLTGYEPDVEEQGKVDGRSIEAGVRLARWFGREAKRVYALLNESAEQEAQRKAVEFIESKGGSITPRDLMRGGPCCATSDDARALLDDLAEGGWGQWDALPTGSAGGRPVERFTLCRPTDTDKTPSGGLESKVLSVSAASAGDQ